MDKKKQSFSPFFLLEIQVENDVFWNLRVLFYFSLNFVKLIEHSLFGWSSVNLVVHWVFEFSNNIQSKNNDVHLLYPIKGLIYWITYPGFVSLSLDDLS